MDDNFNTAAGWVLFAGIIALGGSIVSGKYFQADNPESPEEPGYFIDAPEDGADGPGEMSMAEALNMMEANELVAAGEAVYAKCSACHTINQGGAAGIGPNLYGVMGAAVAGKAGFAYSSALQDVGGTWGWDNMSEWLKSPRAFANGTKMSFAGLSKIQDRAAVIAYMNANGSNLPIPEYVAPAAEEGEDVDGPGEGPGAVEGADPSAIEAAGGAGAAQPVPDGTAAVNNDSAFTPGN